MLATQRRYYDGVHAVKEDVSRPPPSLVGGSLRLYQLGGLKFMVSLVNNRVNGILADEMAGGRRWWGSVWAGSVCAWWLRGACSPPA